MYEDVKEIVFTKEQIAKRIAQLGKVITERYAGEELVMVCVLRGASVFYADLVREINLPVVFDFLQASSYGDGSETSGRVRITKDLSTDIEGKNVIIVEDITDSGITMKELTKILNERKPKSLEVCTLLDKPSRRKVPYVADYVGFTIPDEFIIGYGLDYAQKYRNIPEICVIKPEAVR